MKAKIRNTEIYFDIAGMQHVPGKNKMIERPVMFMLHGGPGGNHQRFKQFSLELQDVAQLVFIDHRGCGMSKKTKQKDYSLENNIEDIEALRKHLGLEKICVYGASYGGVVAQGYAIRYPQNVEKLVLVVTAPSYHFLEEAKKCLHKMGTAKQIAAGMCIWDKGFATPKQLLDFKVELATLYSTTLSKKPSRALIAKMSDDFCTEAFNEGFNNFLRKYNFIPELKKIKCPTLVLAGDKDWICPPSQSKIIAKHIPNAKLKVFKNCGHAIDVDAHDQYIQAIQRFVKR